MKLEDLKDLLLESEDNVDIAINILREHFEFGDLVIENYAKKNMKEFTKFLDGNNWFITDTNKKKLTNKRDLLCGKIIRELKFIEIILQTNKIREEKEDYKVLADRLRSLADETEKLADFEEDNSKEEAFKKLKEILNEMF